MQIQRLPIPPKPAHNRRNNNKLILLHKIPYTPLMLRRIMGCVGVDIEFKGRGEGREDEEQEAAQEPE